MNDLALSLQPNLRSTQHSETLLVAQMARQRLQENKTVYRFGFGQSPFPVPQHVVDALRSSAQCKDYLDVQGLLALRTRVAQFHSELSGVDWEADRVIVGAGSKILLYCLMAAIHDADVALVTPGWVSYEPQAKLAGHRVYRLQTSYEERWRLTPDALDAFCHERVEPSRPLLLVMNYPGNPDGLTYDPTELGALANVLRQHRIIVISDEIYGPLHHRGKHRSLAEYYPEGTIVTSGLSKWCGAGGWRLGITHIPAALGDDYLQGVIGVCSETFSCAPAPIQHAAVAAYQFDARTRSFLEFQRSILADLGNRCAERLQAAGVRVHQPQGGFYLFPDFSNFSERLTRRGVFAAKTMTHALLEDTGVSMLPGSAFGMDEESLTARLAYVDFDGSAALANIGGAFKQVESGIENLCRWLEG
ncbi:MAG: pyridoxal phosphate-dependent aminotransferase [Halioglobus sp.]